MPGTLTAGTPDQPENPDLLARILSTQFLLAAMLVGLALGVVIGANASIYYSLTPMTYPESIRATGAGAAATVGRITTIIAPMAVGILLDAGVGPSVLFIVVALGLIIGGLATWNHVLEQRHAQSDLGQAPVADPQSGQKQPIAD